MKNANNEPGQMINTWTKTTLIALYKINAIASEHLPPTTFLFLLKMQERFTIRAHK